MIYPNLNVTQNPMVRGYIKRHRVEPIQASPQLQDWRKKVGEAEANRISNRAATRGTRIHTLCESYLRGESAEPDIFDQEVYRSLIPHLDKINNIHALEDPLYSDHLEVAGTVDCIAEYDGKLAVIDFKTSARVKTRDNIYGYFMQTSAYAVAFEERTGIPVGKLVIIMGVDDNEPLIFEEKRDDWIGEFKKLRQDYKRIKNI